MTELLRRPANSNRSQVSISSLTLGMLYEAILAFSSQESFETLWPSVCQNARWLIPSRRMGILLCGADGSFEIAGMFDHGQFHKPADSEFTPATEELRRALAQKKARWIKRPWQQFEGETGNFAKWLLVDSPETLFVVPMRVKGRTIGTLLFVMASVGDADQAMLNTLGTTYALQVAMSHSLLRITEDRRRMQNQLIVQERMASLGSLVAGVAHEINNPIGAVQSATDVVSRCVQRMEGFFAGGKTLEDMPSDVSCQKALHALKGSAETIGVASDRIAKIVRSLKSFARLDEAEYMRASIHEGLDSTLILLQSELKDRITVIKEYEEIPSIYCYPAQLNQAFMSLLRNASQAIEGPGTIRVKTMRRGDVIYIQISDSGRGIAQEKLERIFNFGFSEADSRVKMGSGIVTACNIITQGHGGDIKAESEPGKGSSFTITLPINREGDVADPVIPPNHRHGG